MKQRKPRTEEHCKKLSEWKRSEEEKQRLRTLTLGFKHSPETIRKMKETRKKSNHPNWKGGIVMKKGYIYILADDRPSSNKDGYMAQHRYLMELHIGRYLKRTEIVHHINGDTTDNRIENLLLFSSVGEHIKHHHKANSYADKNEKQRKL